MKAYGKEIEAPDNPYWERLNSIAMRQRLKGIETYGQGIESNPAAIKKRIEMALEELVDLGMYLCWICDGISGKESNHNEKSESNGKTG